MSNLWCRKALSTSLFFDLSPRTIKCRISDAERRWAQAANANQASNNAMSNLWCRKALSTLCNFAAYNPRSLCRISDAERRWAQLLAKIVQSGDLCRISDAERRWARSSNTYSNRRDSMSNLWCRKALSTTILVHNSFGSRDVESLMPKGVEHKSNE